MPNNGMIVRISLALAAAAAVAVTATGAGAAPARQASKTVSGAGSTFVQPLVAAWTTPVKNQLGITLNYDAIGSGGGISAIQTRSVNFGASDAPLSPDQFHGCVVGGHGCVQIPWALAGTAVIYHLNGIAHTTHLHLSGAVIAKIYEGAIKYWNDAAIKALNTGVSIPHTRVIVVHRSDGSGTTYNWTDYLSRVSNWWKVHVGTGTSVNWPTGEGESHSSGVAGAVGAQNGAIGYVDVDYAVVNHLAYAAVENRASHFVLPTLTTIKAASLLDTKPAANGELSIVNPPADAKYYNAYPICTYTYVIVPTKTGDAGPLKQLISWAITKGQSYGPKILFVPIVKSIVTFDQGQLKKVHT